MRVVLKSLRLFLLSFPLTFSSVAVSQNGASDALALCKDLSPTNRAMAKSAGYDVDAICSGLSQMTAPAPAAAQAKSEAITPRPIAAQETIADQVVPTAVVGVTAPKPPRSLKPFGYDLFAGTPNTFAPVTNVPVSPDYLLGPGDMLQVMFYGKTNASFSLEINRDGTVNFPELGPVGLAGLTFQEAKDMLQTRIAAQMIGVQASISMGQLRSMQIFVLGEAFKPGAYTVSSLSTITHALFVSGGVSNIASLRNIQLRRAGKVIASLDLYDLLLRGDTSNDVRLQSSDVIFVPTVGDLVSVDGQVLRPAIYELKGGESVQDLIVLAGGLGPKAYSSSARIERIDGKGFLTILDLDLTRNVVRKTALKAGDGLYIDAIKDRLEDIVSLAGHVYYPGSFSWQDGMRLSDLISSLDQFPPGLDLDYAVLSRENPVTGDISAIKFSPSSVIQSVNNKDDLELKSRDKIVLFSKKEARSDALAPLVSALLSQTKQGDLARVVGITGAVQFPGTYPLTEGVRLSDLVLAAGGLSVDYPEMNYALLVREHAENDGYIETMQVDLASAIDQPGSPADLLLSAKDQIVLFSINGPRSERLQPLIDKLSAQKKYNEPPQIVDIGGTVRFPGTYPLTSGMGVEELIIAAGGLTEGAYYGSLEVSRRDLSDPEMARVKVLELSVSDLMDADSTPFLLQPKDVVTLKTLPEYQEVDTVTLSGEIVFPGQYKIARGETLSSVVARAGGFTDQAFVEGAVFSRLELRKTEEEALADLKRRLSEQLAADQLTDVNSGVEIDNQSTQIKELTLARLSAAKAVGRLVIPLKAIIDGTVNDVILSDDDRLNIPRFKQEVTVVGEVQRSASHLFDKRLRLKDYLEASGGFTNDADEGRLYIIKASGEIILPKRRGLFKFLPKTAKIEPGDSIVVPLDTDDSEIQGISLLAEVSKIIYELALGAAAINSFK
jgi:polysaccharide biosynthesis/export protein